MTEKATGPKVKVTISTEDRWEQGVEHDVRSLEIFEFMHDYDWKFNGGSLDLQSGGDGDMGEELMYLMDEYFASLDSETSSKAEAEPTGKGEQA